MEVVEKIEDVFFRGRRFCVFDRDGGGRLIRSCRRGWVYRVGFRARCLKREADNLAGLAVIGKLKIFLLQSANGVALRIAGDDAHQDQIALDLKSLHRVLIIAWSFLNRQICGRWRSWCDWGGYHFGSWFCSCGTELHWSGLGSFWCAIVWRRTFDRGSLVLFGDGEPLNERL